MRNPIEVISIQKRIEAEIKEVQFCEIPKIVRDPSTKMRVRERKDLQLLQRLDEHWYCAIMESVSTQI